MWTLVLAIAFWHPPSNLLVPGPSPAHQPVAPVLGCHRPRASWAGTQECSLVFPYTRRQAAVGPPESSPTSEPSTDYRNVGISPRMQPQSTGHGYQPRNPLDTGPAHLWANTSSGIPLPQPESPGFDPAHLWASTSP